MFNDPDSLLNVLFRWTHIIFGIIWLGHLYFFNLVNVPFQGDLEKDLKPKVNPKLLLRAFYWFRWGAMYTFVIGVLLFGFKYFHQGLFFEHGGGISNRALWILFGGVIGTMHHLYFSGTPAEHLALGAFFSAAEVIPLTFLTVEAWSFLQLGSRQESKSATPFPHRWAVMFLVSVGFWNFLGAGIFGFLINLPIVSYYEIGTALTANHGHAAMMGVYGMLALGLAMFCLRYLIPAERWPERWARICFWSTNIGLAWMCFATLLPLGILQLYKSVDSGYFEARQLKFLSNHTNATIEWLRLPGDLLFIAGGAIPALYIAYLGIRYTVRQVTYEGPETLFTEVEQPEGVGAFGEDEAAAARLT